MQRRRNSKSEAWWQQAPGLLGACLPFRPLLRARAAPWRPLLLRPVLPIDRRPSGPYWGASSPSARWSSVTGRMSSSTRRSAARCRIQRAGRRQAACGPRSPHSPAFVPFQPRLVLPITPPPSLSNTTFGAVAAFFLLLRRLRRRLAAVASAVASAVVPSAEPVSAETARFAGPPASARPRKARLSPRCARARPAPATR